MGATALWVVQGQAASLPLPLGQCRASSTHPLAKWFLEDTQEFKAKSREGNCSRGLDYCLGNVDFSQGSKVSLRRVWAQEPRQATPEEKQHLHRGQRG